ncbi:LOW QUALITY PROTEIN: IF-2B domain-containing protein [Cephalotus follicularis]|uniref:Translation initiation factor eIF2B subunit beta n=1 Tax=Cephalotus follicularis TaxID=3775 RepID=A0A1Q3DG37_CEPFO|nr:LOW QUALITY PROTEIN: IF-2B domain-containing protein [Cephalotus follicularis]
MISRVNMVIVGVHTVMTNGGVIGSVGLNMVTLAQKHSVPVVVLTGSPKLCPMHPNPEDFLNKRRSPSELLDFGEFSDQMDSSTGDGAPLIHAVNTEFDYVPPELVSLFIIDIGAHKPSFMYLLY